MVNKDIRTRVEIKNETQRTTARKRESGRVALIGAFPNGKQRIYAAETFGQIVSHYGVKLNSAAVNWYSGVRAAKRLFMEGINGYGGASSVTCVNICKLTPSDFPEISSDEYEYKEDYDESLDIYDTSSNIIIANDAGTINGEDLESKYVSTDEIIRKDTKLTFEKLKVALQQIADEDMDLLFISNDLWEILDSPYSKYWQNYPVAQVNDTQYTKGDGTLKDEYVGHPIIVKKETRAPSLILHKDGTYGLKCPYVVDEDGKITNTLITSETGLQSDETVYNAVFLSEGLNWQKDTDTYDSMNTINHLVLDTFYEEGMVDQDKVIWEVLPYKTLGNSVGGKFNKQYTVTIEDYPVAHYSDSEVQEGIDSGEYVAHSIVVKQGTHEPVLEFNADGTYGLKYPFQRDPVTGNTKKDATSGKALLITSTTGLNSDEILYNGVFVAEGLNYPSVMDSENGEDLHPAYTWYKSQNTVNHLARDRYKNDGTSQSKITWTISSKIWDEYPIAHVTDYEVQDSTTVSGLKVGYVAHTIVARRTKTGTHIPSLELNEDGTYGLKYPFKRDASGNTLKSTDNKNLLLTTTPDAQGCKLGNDEILFNAVFMEEDLDYPSVTDDTTGGTTTHPAFEWYKSQNAANHLVFNKKTEPEIFDQTTPQVTWEAVLRDELGRVVYGLTDSGKFIRNIGDVYDYILDFIDNEFSNHRPVSYIGAVKTRAIPEGREAHFATAGIGSKIIRVEGEMYDDEEVSQTALSIHTPTSNNPYANIKEWGATEIANLFTRETNELSTCGLFYQGGILAGEEVDAMELAAHMAGWLCSISLSQDLTYQTIPALTAVDEEPFLGPNDAGTLLNEAGIQVIRPKSRLNKTFYINNSVQPTGWHTNHVRTVTYLLKRLLFETGLGINNYITNLEAYRSVLQATAKEVMDENDLIASVEIGEVESISYYHIYVPITILLRGVVTVINIGVGMSLDETGKVGTYIKSTTGYSVQV